MTDARNALEVGAFGFPDDEQPSIGELAMVVLNDSGCSFCNEAFDIESGDAIALYRTHWYHEACMLDGLDALSEGHHCRAVSVTVDAAQDAERERWQAERVAQGLPPFE